MDPQSRILLEQTHQAMLDNNQRMGSPVPAHTGVYVGVMHMEFLQYLSSLGLPISPNVTTGNGMDFLIGRVSYTFGLTGPCLRSVTAFNALFANFCRYLTSVFLIVCSTHTACSSSLVATHLAHTGLLNGDAQAAATSGVFMVLLPGTMSGISQLQALSPVGRCKTFEVSSDGYGRGEGCAVVILRPYQASCAPLGLIQSTVVNQDGRSSSLTAPNGPSQVRLIESALTTAGELC